MISEFEGQRVDYIDGIPTIITSLKGNLAKGFILRSDLTKEATFVAKDKNHFAHGVTARQAVEDVQKKAMADLNIKERIDMFIAKFPTWEKLYKNEAFFDWHGILTGSCEQGRASFARQNNIDMEKESTLEEFFNAVADQYGSEIIKETKEKYNDARNYTR